MTNEERLLEAKKRLYKQTIAMGWTSPETTFEEWLNKLDNLRKQYNV